MGAPRKIIAIFASIVLLLAFVSLFVCVSLIDPSFLYKLWLPYLFIHILIALFIRIVHKKKDKDDGVETHSPAMLFAVYSGFSTGFSIIFISIVMSLCRDPYCSQTRLQSIDPLIIYTIILLFEYFTLCVAFDFLFVKWTGTRNPLYRLCIQYPAILHTTTCVFTSFILWSFPIAAYFSVEYTSNKLNSNESDASTQSDEYLIGLSPVFLYFTVYLFSINGLYNSLFTHWSYIYIDMKNDNDSVHKSSLNSRDALLDNDHTVTEEQKESSDDTIEYPRRCARKTYRMKPELWTEIECNEMNGSRSSITICQLTDPHIGPVMSVNRLNGICRGIVAKDPDLVLLTGDYFTGEANMDGLLIKALEPLKHINERCFACLGT